MAAPELPSLQKPARAPLAFIPGNMDEAWRTAEYLSKSGILPDALRGKPYDILVTIMTGTELGLSPMAAIRDIYVVKGRGYMSALLKIALVKQSPECEYFRLVESTDKKAVFETKRVGEGVTRLEYTIEEAKQADLVDRPKGDGKSGKDNWEKTPKLMLRRRCGSQLADEVYSDVVRGIHDREDLPEQTVNAAPTTFAPPPPQHEEAQLVEETKLEQAVVASTPQTEQQMVSALKDSIAAAPARMREPGDDDDTPIPPAPTPANKTAASEQPLVPPGEDLAIFAALNMAKTISDLDLVAPRAMRVQGPQRDELRKLYKMRKEDILRGAGK